MIRRMLVAAAALGAASLSIVPASAQYADGCIKIGILTDMSGGYDLTEDVARRLYGLEAGEVLADEPAFPAMPMPVPTGPIREAAISA